jgi:hypothetical protein
MIDKAILRAYAAIDIACQNLSGFENLEQDAWREANKARDIIAASLSNEELAEAEVMAIKIVNVLQ